jgi:hypothetical protein
MSNQPHDLELSGLLSLLCARELSDNEQRSLLDRLERDAQAREIYLRHMNLHAELMYRFDDRRESTVAAAASKRLSSPVLSFLGPFATTLVRRPVIYSIALVGIAFYGIFFLLSLNLRPMFLPDAPGSVEHSGAIVAKARGLDGANKPVRIGEPLKIESGTMELELKAGTKLVVEGPADWSVDGKNSVSLRAGKLFARVPQQAIGFTVETPTAKLVDLGTEFGVSVDKVGQTDVHVSKGKVQLYAGGLESRRTPQSSFTLSAGDSRRISIDASRQGRIIEQPIATAKFIQTGDKETAGKESVLPRHRIVVETSGPQLIDRPQDSHFKPAEDDLLQTSLDPKRPSVPAPSTGGRFERQFTRSLSNGRLYALESPEIHATSESFSAIDREGVKFFLNTVKSPNGYDINQIQSITGWSGGRIAQHYFVFIRFLGNSHFEHKALVEVKAPAGALDNYFEQRVRISGKDGALLATGVDAIHFVFLGLEGQSHPEAVYRELDVLGGPTPQESNR